MTSTETAWNRILRHKRGNFGHIGNVDKRGPGNQPTNRTVRLRHGPPAHDLGKFIRHPAQRNGTERSPS